MTAEELWEESVCIALPHEEAEPETLDAIYAAMLAPRPSKRWAEEYLSSLVDAGIAGLYCAGVSLGNSRNWRHYKWISPEQWPD